MKAISPDEVRSMNEAIDVHFSEAKARDSDHLKNTGFILELYFSLISL